MVEIKKSFIQKGSAYFFCLLLYVFLIMKVYRAYSGSSVSGGFWNIIQLFFVFWGGVLLAANNRKLPSSLLIFGCYSFIATFLAFITIPDWEVKTLFDCVTIPYGVMVMLIFYKYGKFLSFEQDFKLMQITFYVLALLIFIGMRNWRLFGEDRGAVADVYYILGLLPIMLVLVKKKFQVIPIAIALLSVLLTEKRAGFLAVITMSLVYYWMQLKHSGNVKKALVTLSLFAILIYIAILIWDNMSELYGFRMFERLQNLGEDGGSGRMDRWTLIINQFAYGSSLQCLFGHGIGSAVRLIGGHVHNDFLEVMYDYGIISLLLYMSFYISLLIAWRRMARTKYRYSTEFLLSVIAALFLASFSFYVIDPTYITCGSVAWGLFLADWEKQKIRQGVS